MYVEKKSKVKLGMKKRPVPGRQSSWHQERVGLRTVGGDLEENRDVSERLLPTGLWTSVEESGRWRRRPESPAGQGHGICRSVLMTWRCHGINGFGEPITKFRSPRINEEKRRIIVK
jgi:hypothetical protein